MQTIHVQDREIRFDVPVRELKCRSSEEIIEKMDPVEDTKGNNGDQVRLRVFSWGQHPIDDRTIQCRVRVSIPGRASCYKPEDHVGIEI